MPPSPPGSEACHPAITKVFCFPGALMASSDSPAAMFSLPDTPSPPPGLQEEAVRPGVTISLLEIGSLPPSVSDSLLPLRHDDHPASGPWTAQTFCNLLTDIKDLLKSVAGLEEQPAEDSDSLEASGGSEAVSELNGPDKTNTTLLRTLLVRLDPDQEENAKKPETIVKPQPPKHAAPEPARYVVGSSAPDRRAFREALSAQAPRGPRDSLELLLREADLWSRQHSELSGLIRSYQNSQKERGASPEARAGSHEGASAQELEEQARKLDRDTQALRLIAALLQNECRILQQRVDILGEFHHRQEKPAPADPAQDRRGPRPAEADKADTDAVRGSEGTGHARDKVRRTSDACLRNKARNNWLNARIARRASIGRRRPSSSSR